MIPTDETDLPMLEEPQLEPEMAPDPEELLAQQEEQQAQAEEAEKEIDDLIRDLIIKAEDEDKDLRYTPLNIWKRNNLYFNNIQNIFLDPIAHDYRTLNSILDDLSRDGVNIDIKVINVYRAYLESIIAALSVEVPAVEFSPDDAENPEDIETAKAYEAASVIIQKRNHAALLLIKALTILVNQGTVFGRSFHDENPDYGYDVIPSEMKQVGVPTEEFRCPQCNTMLPNPNEMQQDQPQMPNQPPMPPPPEQPCPNCGYVGPLSVSENIVFVDEVASWESTPKGKTRFDVFGPTEVKAPLYSRRQADLGYLILREEDNLAKYKTEYKNFELTDKQDSESYERWARLPIEYNNVIPKHIATKRTAWFRPWYFNELAPEQAEILTSNFPEGLKACIIGDTIVAKTTAKIDDEWTVSFDPRADFIHAEPLGNAAIPIQDAENDTFNLGLQCIEYGVPETFVHPKTLNLEAYSKSPAAPGMVSPAVPYAPDKSLAESFHTIKTATLSSEYTNFEKGLETKGQFVTGALASLFGGTSAAGSRTADEYRQSRGQALQRLQIPLRTLKVFWSDLIYRTVIIYTKSLKHDDKFTEKKGGVFINIVVSKSSLNGKAGQITPDMNEQLPQSWPQKREFITSMIEKAPDIAGGILMHPNNADLFKQYTGISDIYIPGERDAHKQNAEYYELSNAVPLSETESSVPIDIHVDDHAVHKLVLKDKMVSVEGTALNPDAYKNCLLHYLAHDRAEQAKMMAQAGKTPPGEAPESAVNSAEGV